MLKSEATNADRKLAAGSLSQVARKVLLARTLRFLVAAGVPPAALAEELRTHASTIAATGSVSEEPFSEENALLVRVASVSHDWCRDPACVDERGEPVSLSEEALGRLVVRRFELERVEEVIAWMQSHGVVAQGNDSRYSLTSRAVVVGRGGDVALERVATLAGQYLETGLHNVREVDVRSKNVDRSARVLSLPLKHVSAFRAFVVDLTQTYLEMVDNWLEERAVGIGNEELGEVVEAAVHSYVYVGRRREVNE
jgi:hypothetical protein